MKSETNWYDYDEGYSIGTSGTDGGIIVRDEEYNFAARMTIEEEGSFAPYSITCTIYGLMAHTRFFSDEAEADEEFDRMKDDLEKILSLVPADGDTLDEISDEISKFVERFP
jgi:hypothetical protein